MKTYDPQLTCENIFALAKERGWSNRKLARILGMTPQAVSKWYRGVGSPSIDMIVIMSELFHVSLDELMGRMETELSFPELDEDVR